jgi:hypothetical protein
MVIITKEKSMTKAFTKAQSNQIAEKTAIIANHAFSMGRDTEGTRIKQYINEQLCLSCSKSLDCDFDNCYLLKDIIAFINSTGNHQKNEIGL